MSWKITAYAPRLVIEAALVAHEEAFDWDPGIVLSGCEIAEDKPEDWRLEAWLEGKPTAAEKKAISALFKDAPASPRRPSWKWRNCPRPTGSSPARKA
ncbi:hypothetical protein [Novosphingobium sp. 9]|uniref:hypothetical protein n=1 Tax=Novosphingobium sp. 9 TaxID=2025349 RepID=UPI00391EF60D